jgi:hypothetical protein
MRRILLLAISLGATASVAVSNAAVAGSKSDLSANLTGAAERPGPGDPDGRGGASIRIHKDKVCYELQVSGISPATAAHIHEAPAGEPGPVVVALEGTWKTKNGVQTLKGCVRSGEAGDIAANPANYYVNVHNDPFPGGAVRGQLS